MSNVDPRLMQGLGPTPGDLQNAQFYTPVPGGSFAVPQSNTSGSFIFSPTPNSTAQTPAQLPASASFRPPPGALKKETIILEFTTIHTRIETLRASLHAAHTQNALLEEKIVQNKRETLTMLATLEKKFAEQMNALANTRIDRQNTPDEERDDADAEVEVVDDATMKILKEERRKAEESRVASDSTLIKVVIVFLFIPDG
jgi:hypothetical protein